VVVDHGQDQIENERGGEQARRETGPIAATIDQPGASWRNQRVRTGASTHRISVAAAPRTYTRRFSRPQHLVDQVSQHAKVMHNIPDYLIVDRLFTPSSRLRDRHLHHLLRAKASYASGQLGEDNLDGAIAGLELKIAARIVSPANGTTRPEILSRCAPQFQFADRKLMCYPGFNCPATGPWVYKKWTGEPRGRP